jgi:hypothetical protein
MSLRLGFGLAIDSAVVPAVIAALGALLLETADHLLLEDGSLLLLG